MKIENFKADFVRSLGEQLSRMYIPALSQRMKFTLILNYLVNVSASHDFLINKVSIYEFADNEFVIRVNHNIEITYVIGKEVVNG